MKEFIYDTIIDAENICNLNHEIKLLKEAVEANKKVVVYGPRNYGKTSVIKSIIIPYFRKIHHQSFVLFADLMEVRSEAAINARIRRSFERSFSEAFPAKNLLEKAKQFISSLSPTISIDPLTALPEISISAQNKEINTFWQDIFRNINNKIAKELPVLIVLDEFQDIAFVDGAQGLFRQVLQEFKDISIVILGSKQHLLSDIFAAPNAPLANFGEDIEFYPIEYTVYHKYMEERFVRKNLSISLENSKKLQDLMQRVPEAINIICANLLYRLNNQEIKWKDITDSLFDVLAARSSRYEKLLSFYSEAERNVLINLQKNSPLKQPNGKDFLSRVSVSQGGVRKIIKSFIDSSAIEQTAEGYRLSDPLLANYIRQYR